VALPKRSTGLVPESSIYNVFARTIHESSLSAFLYSTTPFGCLPAQFLMDFQKH
jgi:hypothetical protein